MNYLGLISICLGLLSIAIAFKFLNVLKNIDKKLNLNQECKLMKNIQSKSGLTIKQIKNKILDTEPFKNYKQHKDRNILDTNQFSKKNLVLSNNIPKVLEHSKKILEKSFPKVFSNKKCTSNSSLYDFNNYNTFSNKYCMVNQGTKNYCFKTPFIELCPGKVVTNTKKCHII